MYVMINEPLIYFSEETTAIGCMRHGILHLRKRSVN